MAGTEDHDYNDNSMLNSDPDAMDNNTVLSVSERVGLLRDEIR